VIDQNVYKYSQMDNGRYPVQTGNDRYQAYLKISLSVFPRMIIARTNWLYSVEWANLPAGG
jgi:hypothetical protein